MTNKQALKEATKRWGKKAAIRPLSKAKRVGYIAMGMFFNVEGEGDTWEKAFAAADAKAIDDKRRYGQILEERKCAK